MHPLTHHISNAFQIIGFFVDSDFVHRPTHFTNFVHHSLINQYPWHLFRKLQLLQVSTLYDKSMKIYLFFDFLSDIFAFYQNKTKINNNEDDVGGGSGIGRAVSAALIRDGVKVAVVDRDINSAKATVDMILKQSKLSNSGNPLIHAYAADVSKLAEVEAACKQAENDMKADLSIGVNCAGITIDKFIGKMTEQDFDKVINVNLKGTFFVMKAVSERIISKQKESPQKLTIGSGGSIINISSIIGKVGNLGQANYSASKGGVISMTKTAAKEFARNQIRVNAILPGFIDTPMAQAVPDKVKSIIVPQIPLGAFGEPEDIANACAFLASDKAKYITGSTIEITGGLYM